MDIYQYLKAATVEKKDLDFNNNEVNDDYSPFIVNRFVSMVEYFVPLINAINKYDVPKSVHYNYLKNSLPKRYISFKYIRKKKDLTLTEKKCIAHYFEIGLKEADYYIKMMEQEDIKKILEIYEYGKNQIADV